MPPGVAEPPPVRGARLAALWLGCCFLGVLLMPGFNSLESPSFATVSALVREGHLWVAHDAVGVFHRGVDGHVYEVHEIGATLFAVPFAGAAAVLERWGVGDFQRLYELALGFGSAALFATTFVLLLGIAGRLQLSTRATAPRLLLALLGSQYMIYATSPSDTAIATPLLAGGLLAFLRADDGDGTGWLAAGLLAGLLVAVKLPMATVGALVVVGAATSRPAGRSTMPLAVGLVLLGLGPGLALAGWWNAVRTGAPWLTPYPASIHGYALQQVPEALAAAVLSPNKGLLAYTPVLLMLPWAFVRGGPLRTRPRLALLAVGSLLLTLARVSGTLGHSGWGGWGNRYYVPWVPVLVLLVVAVWIGRARSRWWGVACAVLVALGGLINVAGVLTNPMYRQQLCGFASWTVPGMNVCAVTALPGNVARVVGARVPDVVVPGASTADVYASNRLAVWWYAVRAIGVPGSVSWGVAGVLTLSALACWWYALRRPSASGP